MYSIPARILNQVAETQELRLSWVRNMFKMDQAKLYEAIDAQAVQLEAQGIASRVVSGFQLIAGLLAENEAITAYINATDQHGLRSCMPEITTVEEAVFIADQEYQLDDNHKVELADMLRAMLEYREMEENNAITAFGRRLDANPRARQLLLEVIERHKAEWGKGPKT